MKINRRTITFVLRVTLSVTIVALIVFAATDVFACPTCKDALGEGDPASQAQARGFFYSILFMMAMPFLLLGTLGGAAYVSIRRAREQQASAAMEVSAVNVPVMEVSQ